MVGKGRGGERPWWGRPCWPIQSPNNGRKKGERLTGERDNIKFINLTFERGQVAYTRKEFKMLQIQLRYFGEY